MTWYILNHVIGIIVEIRCPTHTCNQLLDNSMK